MKYLYRAVDEEGMIHSGDEEAPSLFDAAEQLRQKGWTVLTMGSAEPRPPGGVEGFDAFVFFNRSLADLTRTGMPLVAAVDEIARGMRRGRFRASLEKVEAALRDGRPLDEALKSGDFPDTYRWLVRAGLAAGRLPAVLGAVAVHSQIVRALKRGIFKALIYPAVVLAAGLVGATLLASIVFPIYATMHQQVGLQPPSQLGLWIVIFCAVTVVGSLMASVVAGFAARRRPGGERKLWKVPILGPLLRNLCLERFFASLQILVESRVPLFEALPVAAMASGSTQFASSAERLSADLGQGKSLASALELLRLPRPIHWAIEDGERQGRLAEAIAGLRSRATEESEWASGLLLMVLEPAAVAVAGALMGGIYYSMIGPYLNLLGQMSTHH